MKGQSRVSYVKPISAGLMLGISRLPIHLGFLVFFAFIPIFIYSQEDLKKRNVIIGSIYFSITYTLAGLQWICLAPTQLTSISSSGVLSFFTGFGVLIALIVLFSAYFTILFLVNMAVRKEFPALKIIGFLMLWLSFEYLQNFGEFRFPWFNIGYSLHNYNWMLQILDIGGLPLVTIMILLINYWLFKFLYGEKNYLYLCLGVLLVWMIYGAVRVNTIDLQKKDLTVGVVQANIPQHLKWEASFEDSTFARYENLSKKMKSDLLIWSESSLPVALMYNQSALKFTKRIAAEEKANILIGFQHFKLRKDGEHNRYDYFNSATQITSKGDVQKAYYKNMLVPFGERMPFLSLFPFLWSLDFGQANFRPGTEFETYRVRETSYSPIICYEIAFPSVFRRIAHADFVVNISNDAWFKKSPGTFQHADMARFRAIESRIQIVRSANTGISLSVDPRGRYLHRSKIMKMERFNTFVYDYAGTTFYNKYGHWLPLINFLLTALLVIVAIGSKIFLYSRL